MPGDNVEMVAELVHDVAAEIGSRFTLREGGKTSKSLPLVSNGWFLIGCVVSWNRYHH